MTFASIPRLITMGSSHYCEKARWALEWLEIPYVEERHLPPFHRLYTQLVGGTTVPVMITATATFVDSSDILHSLDEIALSYKRLYPSLPDLRRQIDELEDTFNYELGPCVRCWTYFYLLNDWHLMQLLWGNGAPRCERILLPSIFPLVCGVVRRMYNIKVESAMNSYNRIHNIFQMVGDLLADGRPYLVGDRFSAADITFASLAAPTVFPERYGVTLPQLNQLPYKMADKIQVLRETPAGNYVLRLYRERSRAAMPSFYNWS